MSAPDGLEETIEQFLKACASKGKGVDREGIREKMIERLTPDFARWESEWPAARTQVLTVARLSGRLASAYAELDGGKTEVRWSHARHGLQDGKEECRQTARGKHCQNADFESD